MNTWIDWLADELKTEAAYVLTPLQAALGLATRELRETFQPSRVDEETITSTFLGALKAHAFWTVKVIGTPEKSHNGISWSHFNKARASNPSSEAACGADFALIVRESENCALLSIFQAKIIGRKGPKSNPPRHYYINVYHRPNRPAINKKTKKRPAWRDSQLVTLVETGRSILTKLGIGEPITAPFSELGWLHYLGYCNKTVRCIPISRLEAAYNAEKAAGDKKLSSHEIALREVMPFRFTHHLDLSRLGRPMKQKRSTPRLASEFTRLDGWLAVDYSKLKGILPTLISLMDLYIADDTSDGWSPMNNLLPDDTNMAWSHTTFTKQEPSEAPIPPPPKNLSNNFLRRGYRN